MGRGIRFRLGFLFVCFFLFFAFVGFRLVQLQVTPNAALTALAERQFQRVDRTAAYREPIFDRNGEELAVSIPSSSVFARPKMIRARRKTARILAKILGGSPARWLNRLDIDKSFVWIHRQLNAEAAKRLASHKLRGIFTEPENKRIYPNGNLASHVLGFTDIDGNGLSGLELALNGQLLAKEVRVPIPRDGKGNPSYLGEKHLAAQEDAKRGIYVTLDRRLQHAVEEELQKSVDETDARAVFAIVMAPHTGEVFAFAQYPSFDPNFIRQSSSSVFANRLTSYLYEPGSTMKVILAAEALEEKLLSKDSLIDCGQGKIVVGKETLREAEADHKFGLLSLGEALRVSSNVGAVKVAHLLGANGMRSALDRFGLTAKTGIGLPGEISASMRSEDHWTPIHLATAGFGQGISTTPLQMVASFAPFANGGYLVKPRLLIGPSAITGIERVDRKSILSPETAATMAKILTSVTEAKGGTGAAARVPGVRVAGKTGTAQKYEAGVGYNSGKYYSSFIGFLPADRPELIIGVMVDEPKGGYYANQVAAPLFRRVAERSLHILGRGPRIALVASHPPKTAKKRAVKIRPESSAPVVTKMEDVSEGKWLMPDLKGVSVREAIQTLGKNLPNVKVSGSGFLEGQSPKPGTVVDAKDAVVLNFSPAG